MSAADDIYDQWLVLSCQDGDEDALRELVERWQPRLARHALRLTGQSDAARDAVQAAWVAILSGLRRLDDPACFRRWAYRIITNKCADWVRARRRSRDRQIALSVDPIDKWPREASKAIDDLELHRAIERLSLHHRTVLKLFYLENLSLREVADALALSEGAVKSRLHYSRLKLKEILERNYP